MVKVAEVLNKIVRPFQACIVGCLMTSIFFLTVMPVLAQTAEEGGGGGFKGQLMVIILAVIGFASEAILRFVSKQVNKGFDLLNKTAQEKIENTAVESAVIRLSNFGRMIVLNTWRTTVKEAKLAAKDGKITKIEKKAIKDGAVAELKSITPRAVLDALLGRNAGEDRVTALLGATVEAALHDVKEESKAVKNSTVKNS